LILLATEQRGLIITCLVDGEVLRGFRAVLMSFKGRLKYLKFRGGSEVNRGAAVITPASAVGLTIMH